MQTYINSIKTLLPERSQGQAQTQNFSDKEVVFYAVSSLFDEAGVPG